MLITEVVGVMGMVVKGEVFYVSFSCCECMAQMRFSVNVDLQLYVFCKGNVLVHFIYSDCCCLKNVLISLTNFRVNLLHHIFSGLLGRRGKYGAERRRHNCDRYC